MEEPEETMEAMEATVDLEMIYTVVKSKCGAKGHAADQVQSFRNRTIASLSSRRTGKLDHALSQCFSR